MSQVIEYFLEISKIPRNSKNEGKIREYLKKWFHKKGYKTKVDSVGNLFVYVPSTNENLNKAVILQAHMDMVCVKTPQSNHDFNFDEIKVYENEGFLRAKDTTLGSDNGIGLALCMSSVDFPNRPPLELVFTVDEEDGMSGVLGMDFSHLSGDKLINLDMEEEDFICISSAGGIGIDVSKKITRSPVISGDAVFRISVFGLKGGHSGIEIHKNRGNAIKILLDFLSNSEEFIGLYNIEAGYASNVIPSKITVEISISDLDIFQKKLNDYLEEISHKIDCDGIDYKLEIVKDQLGEIQDGKSIIETLNKIQDGVYFMSEKIPDLVQTSMNLGVISIDGNNLKMKYLLRSSDNSQLNEITEQTMQYFLSNGFHVDLNRGYLGWQDDPNSHLLQVAVRSLEKVLGHKPRTIAVHAGLECGSLVAGLGGNLNAISIGPNMYDVHSVDERVEIKSIEKIHLALKLILEELANG
ncbi:MAG: beta-Ala-His dipeptidase [Candidatus Absconditabacteria bacterium]